MPGSLCERYGPGRIPVSRDDIKGGIAMGATALLAVCVWFGGAVILVASGAESGVSDFVGFGVAAGLFVAPFAVASAFVTGFVLWKGIQPNTPGQGAVWGLCTSGLSLSIAGFGTGVFLALDQASRGYASGIGDVLLGIFSMTIATIIFASILAGWVIFPLGAFGGWYHLKAKQSEESQAR